MEETQNSLQQHVASTLASLKRYEGNITDLRLKINKLKSQKALLEENILLLSQKLESVNDEKTAYRMKLEKIRATIGQIEAFKMKISETYDAMLNSIKKEREIFDI